MKKRGLLALTCLLCVAGWLASTAAACHSEVSASIDCSGVVSYTASAWNEAGATTAQRTNSNVQVSASTDGRTFSPVASGHFGRDNNFSFGGTFPAGSASTVWVKVQEVANWGNGEAPAAARMVQVTKSGCGTGGGGTVNTPPVVSLAVEKLERVSGTAPFVAGPVSATVGQTIEYQINVRDTGNVMLWVTITDTLCDPGTLSAPGGLGVGPTGTVTFTCSHVTTAGDVGTLTNTATATGVAGNGVSATGTATAVAQVTAAAAPSTSTPAGGVAGTTHTVHKAGKTKAAKKSVRHAKPAAAKAAHHKKVTKKAKPAKAVVRGAHYTG